MLNVTTTAKNGNVQVTLAGRIDTTTAPELEAQVKPELDGATSLTLDMKGINYISSAGLRVLLSLQKQMSGKQGEMKVQNVNETVYEIFEITGFSDILDIEKA